VTQSTVSARIQHLEADLGARLFVRNRSGASLTPAGRRFLQHANSLVLTVEQARHDVGLPNRYRATVRIGGRIALWEGFLPHWVRMAHLTRGIAVCMCRSKSAVICVCRSNADRNGRSHPRGVRSYGCDGGTWPSGVCLQRPASNRPERHWLKTVVVSVGG
jgi:hypothetical protein